jgi:hypothetical protein
VKNFLVLIVLVACAGAGYYYVTEGKSSSPPAAATPAAAAKPIDKMRAIVESNGMKLQSFMDSGGGNLTFVLRSPDGNAHSPQSVVDTAIANGIISSAELMNSSKQSDTFNGDFTDSSYMGVLKQQ